MIQRLAFSDLTTIEEPLSLALGVFDGIHCGHQEVFRCVIERAKASNGLAGVLTFEPHPVQILAPERAPRRLLASLQHKAVILQDLGIDLLVVVDFDLEFAARSSEEFLQMLRAVPQLHSLAMGADWRFGKARQGDAELLRAFGEENGILIDSVPAVMDSGERVSSTRIRQALRDGNIAAAEEMLGRPYSIVGQVVEGKKLGRTIGFPTANLVPSCEQLPPAGVWAVEVLGEEQEWLPGVANLGVRPTVSEAEKLQMEVHLLDWEGSLYYQDLEVRFRKFLRGEQKFADLKELTEQITRDANEARQFFKR